MSSESEDSEAEGEELDASQREGKAAYICRPLLVCDLCFI